MILQTKHNPNILTFIEIILWWYDANLGGDHDFICLRHSSFLDLFVINHFTLLDLKILC